jgi:hypothetical protein
VVSEPVTEWPASGIETTPAGRGKRRATFSASSVGVRRSARPERTSAGTSGSGPGAAGAGVAFGHDWQRRRSPNDAIVAGVNGPSSAGVRARSASPACRTRSAGGASRAHGSRASSQFVASSTALLPASPGACAPGAP